MAGQYTLLNDQHTHMVHHILAGIMQALLLSTQGN